MKNVFIITSIIYFKDNKLSYSKSRSIYSPFERTEQTISTINSIKNKDSEAKIILLESGLKEKIDPRLISSVDEYIYLGKIKIVRWLVDSKYKGAGEAIMLIMMKSKIIKTAQFIFKISGRYVLNNNFNIDLWKKNFTCKIYRNSISTRLYGFPSTHKTNWIWVLIKSLPLLLAGNSIEDAMFRFSNKNILNDIKILGIEGHVAPDGQTINE
jgi:hypothetical protein